MQNDKKGTKDIEQFENDKYEQDLIAGVEEDFERRRKERLSLERQWELNMNFLQGNQYCGINSRGEIETDGKEFFWQSRGVFNHIAPIIDSRLAKFIRIQPQISVRPKSDDDKDVSNANVAEKLIENAFKLNKFSEVAKKVISWSETCGTGFYKVVWDNLGGNALGEMDEKQVFEGEVKILAVSPFEIFPDNIYNQDIDDCESIIHARAMGVNAVYEKYGVLVKGEKLSVFNLQKQTDGQFSNAKETVDNSVIVIERYERPNNRFPQGRMVTVAGGKLLYVGELPYITGDKKQKGYPFVKQTSMPVTGAFFGTSIIDRLIPIQRALNAVKNRKHEFLNRLSMGILTVEDGSVDVDDLAEDGLSPGKVLVYRQGSKAPEIMSETTIPPDFSEEESRLINEFVIVSGVSDVSSSSSNASLSSGTALEILVEQDNARLIMTAEEIRNAYLGVAKKVIRLYAQFTEGVRAIRLPGEYEKVKIFYADEGVMSSDDVYLDSENELLYTHSQKKEMLFKLYESGLLHDDEGKIRSNTKEKLLSLLGYKDLDYQKGLSRLHEEKALDENERMRVEDCLVEEIDNDEIHIDEHTRYVLSEYKSLNDQQKQRYYTHILKHKERTIEKGEQKNGTSQK